MNRDEQIANLNNTSDWDFIIIGGGATGVGTALDAASRGYKTLLLEQNDFGKATSSRSTKLIHGGVRYLKQGNISLVLEALKERGILCKNAPHLIKNIPFVVPRYEWWEGAFYGVGLKLYDLLAGKYGFGDSQLLSIDETLKRLPNLETKGLKGGIIYFDGQFDDTRLLINLVQTSNEQGATVLNYFKVISLIKQNGFCCGVIAEDLETGKIVKLYSKVIINATGIFSDSIRKMDDPDAKKIIAPSRGTHIVLDGSFLAGNTAIMIPHTDDGRVLFAIPWYGKVVVGTTDISVNKVQLEPVCRKDEIDFLLSSISKYLIKDPGYKDVLSVFSGIRPLVKSGVNENTAAISRDHTINISKSGLITIAGGKWTTYRKMAQDTVDNAITLAQLKFASCITESLPIHGSSKSGLKTNSFYGSDEEKITEFSMKNNLNKPIHPKLNIREGEVLWAVKNEMARTAEDFLARRTRTLFLDAKSAIESSRKVAELMASQLNKKNDWIEEQIAQFKSIAKNYLVDINSS